MSDHEANKGESIAIQIDDAQGNTTFKILNDGRVYFWDGTELRRAVIDAELSQAFAIAVLSSSGVSSHVLIDSIRNSA